MISHDGRPFFFLFLITAADVCLWPAGVAMMPPIRGLAFLYISLREGLSPDIKAGKRDMKLDCKIKTGYGNI